jgi:integrase
MPKYPGVHRKNLKSGNMKYYGAKWYKRSGETKGKSYTTALYSTAAEAADARDGMIQQLKKGMYLDKKKVTVEQFLTRYCEKYLIPKVKEGDLEESSYYTIENYLRNGIAKRIGSHRLQQLEQDPEEINELKLSLLKHYTPKTTSTMLSVFKTALKIAKRWKYITHNPLEDIDNIKIREAFPNVLTDEEFMVLFQNAPMREKTMVALGRLAGLRISEVLGLKREDIIFKQDLICVQRQWYRSMEKTPKGNKPRYVPLLPDLKPILETWLLQCNSEEWLFTGPSGRPLNGSGWQRSHYYPLLERLDLPKVKFHSFRHCFNKMLYDAGLRRRDVMQITGHSSVKMSMHYDRESPKHLVKITRSVILFNDSFLRISLRI